MHGLSWDDLRFIEALERLGKSGDAARELGVATSTVYRRITTLERGLGVRCVEEGGGVTARGRELAELARNTQTALSGIARRAHDHRAEAKGVVTLTTVDGFAPLLVEPLAQLARHYPGLRVHLHIDSRGLSLRKRQADIALSIVPRPPPHLIGRKLFTIEYAVYGVPRLAERPHDAGWIVLGWPLSSTREARWEQKHVPDASVVVATPSRRAFLDLVRAGVGVGLLPRPLARLHPQLQELEEHRPTLLDVTRPAWLLTHPELRDETRVRVVMDAIGDSLSEPE